MKSTTTCDCPNKSKDLIVITIETCCRRPCAGALKGRDSKTSVVEELAQQGSPTASSAKSSSSTSVFRKESSKKVRSQDEIEQAKEQQRFEQAKEQQRFEQAKEQQRFKLPLLPERHHGPGCAMEISVLEKHESNCLYKKDDIDGRNDLDDRVGSYDCIGRLVFRTCNSDEVETIESKHQGVNSGWSGSPGDAPPVLKSGSGDRPLIVGEPLEPLPQSRERQSSIQSQGNMILVPEDQKSQMIADRPKSQISYAADREASFANVGRSSSLSPAGSKRHSQISHVSSKQPSQPRISREPSRQSQDTSKFESMHSYKTPQASTSKHPIQEEQIDEEYATTQNRQPNYSGKKSKKKRHEQVMIAAASTTSTLTPFEKLARTDSKKHYYGDDCKLHIPRSPLFINSGEVEKIAASNKVFPIYTDEANQTEPNVSNNSITQSKRDSEETITSLSEFAKPEGKRKTSFLGSIFRRNSAGKTNATDSKKQIKK